MADPAPLLSDPALYAAGIPTAEFARLRREAPVAWVEEPVLVRHAARGRMARQGRGFWAVTRHHAVAEVSRSPDRFSSAARGVFIPDPSSPQELAGLTGMLINMDPPRHTAVRRVASRLFTPRAVERLRHDVLAHARTVLTPLIAGEEIDVVTDLAVELPVLVLADLLGMPRQDRHLLAEWSDQLVGFDDPAFGGGDIERFRAVFDEAFAYALDLAGQRLRRPGDDLVTRLVTSRVDGRRLTSQELCYFWLLLVVAGNETTRNLISGSIEAFAQWPAERARLVAAPGLTPRAVEELLRWVTPIMQFRRTATRDVVLDGQPIAAGDKVVVYYTSANRDEAVFVDPDRLDLAREPNPHLAFGVGPHFCLGAHLARLELATLLDELRPHLPGLELVGPARRLASHFMASITSLPARFGPHWR